MSGTQPLHLIIANSPSDPLAPEVQSSVTISRRSVVQLAPSEDPLHRPSRQPTMPQIFGVQQAAVAAVPSLPAPVSAPAPRVAPIEDLSAFVVPDEAPAAAPPQPQAPRTKQHSTVPIVAPLGPMLALGFGFLLLGAASAALVSYATRSPAPMQGSAPIPVQTHVGALKPAPVVAPVPAPVIAPVEAPIVRTPPRVVVPRPVPRIPPITAALNQLKSRCVGEERHRDPSLLVTVDVDHKRRPDGGLRDVRVRVRFTRGGNVAVDDRIVTCVLNGLARPPFAAPIRARPSSW